MATSEPSTSPPRFRIGGLAGFLPLSDDFVSTRGQRLPGLLQSRPRSTFRDEEGGEDVERDAEAGQRRAGLQRRLSAAAAEVLMTPQMRSMRLIGNSNARYQWWVPPRC